jgi:hypothetical protein
MQWEWECRQQEWAQGRMEAREKLEDEDFDWGGVVVSGSWLHRKL